MKYAVLLALVFAVGCSGSSPTAPSPVVVTPPVVVVPPTVVTPPNPVTALLSDPQFSRAFYRMFALGTLDLAGQTATLKRHLRPPLFYVMTVDNRGTPIDARTLDATAAALINTAPMWNGGLGIEGLSFGASEPPPLGCLNCAPDPAVAHHVAVKWDNTTTNSNFCARTDVVGGNIITVFLRTPRCGPCLGLAVAPAVIKHELGHVMGFWHTDSVTDVMGIAGTATCDLNPSAREQFHGRLAYMMPNGSMEP